MLNIYIDDEKYVLTEDSVNNVLTVLKDKVEGMLDNFSPIIRAGIETFINNYLYDMEKKLIEKGVVAEVAKQIRPAKGQSSIYKMLNLVLSMKETLHGTEIRLTTRDREITAISYGVRGEDKSKGGG